MKTNNGRLLKLLFATVTVLGIGTAYGQAVTRQPAPGTISKEDLQVLRNFHRKPTDFKLLCQLIPVSYERLSDPYQVPYESLYGPPSDPTIIYPKTVTVTPMRVYCPSHCTLPANAVIDNERVNEPATVPAGASELYYMHYYAFVDYPPPENGPNPNLRCESK